ncbi:hypothetical protein [Portibacter marinus]|uniref:hypothetical protein n=1 Tax=Portibacter marinus TaxID=2898660 RepID=UPI001F3C40E5|nr:hypothetical protein [Portibacter marinus]
MNKLIQAFFCISLLTSGLTAQIESLSHDINGVRVFHQTVDSASMQVQHMNWGKTANNISSGLYSTTWGTDNEASSNQATAWGNGNTASSFNTTAFGNRTIASGSHATSWGAFTVASGVYSTASGSETDVSGGYAMGWGRKNTLSSAYGAVWGQENNVGFTYGTAWGYQNDIEAHFGTAWGKENRLQSQMATTWGYNNTVTGDTSTVWGSTNQALAMHNSIWGTRNSSSGTFSTLWGLQNDGSADHSTMWGSFNTCLGAYGTIWGRNNRNTGAFGTVWGEDLTANSYLNTVFGRYNVNRLGTEGGWKDEETLLAVGNGNEDEARDGLIMLKNGKVGLNFLAEEGLPKEILDVHGNIHSTQHVKANQVLANQAVGIGTMTPSQELEVVSTTDSSHVVIKSTASVSLLELDGSTQSAIKMLDNGTVNAEMRWSGSSFDLYSSPPVTFPLLRTPTIKMTTNNYVGIRKGLLAPTEVLDVNGRIKLGDGSNTPSAGVMRYNQSLARFEGYNGFVWNTLDGLPIDGDGDTKMAFAESAVDSVKFIVNGDEQMSFNGHSLDLGKKGNTFIGHQSARQDFNDNTGNTSLGWLSTPFIFNGLNNTHIGNSAGHDLTTGDFNTVVGASAMLTNQNGSKNTVLGYNAGRRNTGDGNIFIGYLAGHSEPGSNKLYIENTTNPNPLIYGDFEIDSLALNGDVEIGGDVLMKANVKIDALSNSFGLIANVIALPDGRMVREFFPSINYHSSDFTDWIGMVGNIKQVKNMDRDLQTNLVIEGIRLKYVEFDPTAPNLVVKFMRRNLNTGAFETIFTITETNIPTTPIEKNYSFAPVTINKELYSYFLATEFDATQIIELTLIRDL